MLYFKSLRLLEYSIHAPALIFELIYKNSRKHKSTVWVEDNALCYCMVSSQGQLTFIAYTGVCDGQLANGDWRLASGEPARRVAWGNAPSMCLFAIYIACNSTWLLLTHQVSTSWRNIHTNLLNIRNGMKPVWYNYSFTKRVCHVASLNAEDVYVSVSWYSNKFTYLQLIFHFLVKVGVYRKLWDYSIVSY